MNLEYPSEARQAGQAVAPDPTEAASFRAFYLRRLDAIINRVNHRSGYLVSSDRRMVLLFRALLSTYRQCTALGVEGEARRMVERLRDEQHTGQSPAPGDLSPRPL